MLIHHTPHTPVHTMMKCFGLRTPPPTQAAKRRQAQVAQDMHAQSFDALETQNMEQHETRGIAGA